MSAYSKQSRHLSYRTVMRKKHDITTNDKGDHYIYPSSHQSTSDSIPTVSPTLAQSEDEPSNANSAGVTTAITTARQAVSKAGTPIAHKGAQPHNPAACPPLQHYLGSEGRPTNHHSVSKPPPVTAAHVAQPLLQTTLLTDHQGFMVSIKTAVVEPTVAIKAQQRLVSKCKRVDIEQWRRCLGEST
jgi:hypothetical protein